MISPEDENSFTNILTTAPNDMKKDLTRRQSWLEKRKRTFSGNGMITCPSCRGSGVKDASTDLVALIPYSDERLKPRFTKCKILFALLVCAVLLSVSTYIFLPGKVIVTTTNLTILNASVADYNENLYSFDILKSTKDSRSNITWKVDVTVENRNRFLSITVNKLQVDLKWDVNDQIEVGSLVHGNFTVGGHQVYSSAYNIETPQEGKGKYSDYLLTCKCCRQYTHCGKIHMFSSITLHYTLHVGKFNYFSNFVSSDKLDFDNCNYFDNMGIKNITCETFNSCHRDGRNMMMQNLEDMFV